MTGVFPNLYIVLPRSLVFDFTGMFDIAENLVSAIIEISKVAFASGSSQHGNARLASAASNCVVARYFVFPPCLY